MNHNCSCGGRWRPTARKVCCTTGKTWMVFTCDSCGKAAEQGLRMAKGSTRDGEVGSKGFLHYKPYP